MQQVVVAPADTTVGSAGSTSASLQAGVTGGAVKAAWQAVLQRAAVVLNWPVAGLLLDGEKVVGPSGEVLPGLAEVLGDDVVEQTVEWRHRPTHAVDPETGQGDAHVQFAFSAHRAVVDVDTELGLVKVVALDTAQDVEKAINPDAVVGQIHDGSAQGMGLALMEEVAVTERQVRNPSFTDYLLPTILEMPPMQVQVLEHADPHAPYGVGGVGSRTGAPVGVSGALPRGTAIHHPFCSGNHAPSQEQSVPLLDHPVDGSGRPAGRPAHRRPVPVARRRTRRLVWAGVLVAAVLGLALLLVPTVVGESSGSNPPARSAQSTEPAGGLLPLPATARMPDEQLHATIVDLEDLVRLDPDAAGPEADEVLDSLRQVQVLGGGEQRSAAVVAHDAVGAAVADGGLAPAVGQRVQEVLAGVARPERLIDLVQTVDADPPAIGPAGPGLRDPLIALDHQVPADQTADRAANLLTDVRNAAARGEVSQSFADAAIPTLEQLADPEPYRALRDLLAEAERDPGAIGPASEEVLTSLRAIAELPVWPQGNEVGLLLELVRQDGQVTPAFREAAVPVLVPLVR